MSSVKPPPGIPPSRRRSRNPKFKGADDSSDKLPVADIFPSNRQSRAREERKKKRAGSPTENSRASQKNPVFQRNIQNNRSTDFRMKLRDSVQKGSTSFAKAFFKESDSEDSDFDPSDVEDIDYEERVNAIENLGFREKIFAKKIPGRLGIALTAVALIWLTSLGLIRFIVAEIIFPSPTLEEVGQESDEFFDLVETERNNYDLCATDVSNECEVDLGLDTARELSRVLDILEFQDAFLVDFEVARSESKQRLNDTLIDVSGFNDLILVLNPEIDDLSECPRVANLVDSSLVAAGALSRQLNVETLTNEALDDLIENFKRQQEFSDAFWAAKDAELLALNTQLADQFEERSDEITNILDEKVGDITSCFNSTDCNGISGEGLQGIFEKFDSLTAEDTDNKESSFADVDQQVDTFLNLYDGVLQAVDDIGVPSDNFRVEVGDVEFDEFFNDNQERIDRFNDATAGTFDDFENAVDNVGSNAATAGSDFRNDALAFETGLIEPYRPPELDETAREEYENDQAQRNTDLSDRLVATNEESNEDNFFEPAPKQADPTEFVEDVISEFEGREISFFSYPDDVFRSIELGISNVLTIAVALDVFIRIAMTIMSFNKYWKLSKIGKPPGDVRVEELIGKVSGTKKTAQQKLYDRIFSPAVLNTITLFFTIFIVSLIFAIYSPFYDEFIEGCRENSVDSLNANNATGTMIFNNVFAAFTSFAAQPGDAKLTTTVDFLNNNRSIVCEANTIETADRTEDQFELFLAINDDYQNTLSFRNEIDRCLDLDELDSRLGTNTRQDMDDASFSFNIITLESGVFNCSNLDLCDVVALCDFEVAQSRIQRASFSVSCNAEQLLHSTIFSFILIILIYVTMFIFRKNFLRALVRIFWRDINPYDFNILATCLRDGTHVDPERVAEDGFTFQDTATLALHKAIRQWERESWFYLIVSIGMHIPWIFGGVFLREGFH